MKYKVGDKVRVKNSLKAETHYRDEGGHMLYFNSKMEAFCGQTLTISAALSNRYKVTENGWTWCAEMFEGLVEDPEPQRKFKVGDRVVGNSKANAYYGLTKKGWKGYVVKVYDHSKISVCSIAMGDDICFDVKSDCFDLVETAAEKPQQLHTDWTWEDLF